MASIKKYAGPWTEKQRKHLCRRVLFGYTPEDKRLFSEKSLDECLSLLLTPSPIAAPPVYYDIDDAEVPKGSTAVFAREKSENEENRMLYTKSWLIGLMRNQRSITERMTMFWHNHFATEFNTVKDNRYNYQYFALIRQHATGNFKKLLRGMTTNTQMLVYLNGNLNNKVHPNENFAREVQELFTIGKGPGSHYTESDVQNAAKVLTGWRDDKEKIDSFFDPENHNTDDKVFSSFYNNQNIKGRSGIEGALETDELLDMLCKQNETARFLCRKLYRWFVSCNIDDTVEATVIAPLSEIMIKENYEVKPVLKAMLSAEFFYDPFLTGSIIKSPVDFGVELLRQFKIWNIFEPDADWRIWAIFSLFTSGMGQDIGNPPAVAGWPAYYEYPLFDKEWVTSGHLFERQNVIKMITGKADLNDKENNVRIDVMAFADTLTSPDNIQNLLAELTETLFCVPLGPAQNSYLEDILNKKIQIAEPWNNLWTLHKAGPDKEDLKEEVKERLRLTLASLLVFPEFQIR